MKNFDKLKLGQLSKDAFDEKGMNLITGGGFDGNRCDFGDDNRAANEQGGVCSCGCVEHDMDYYGTSGLRSLAEFYKYTD